MSEKRGRRIMMFGEWNPGVAFVTMAAVVIIVALTALSALAVHGLKEEVSILGSEVVAMNDMLEHYANVTTTRQLSYEYLKTLASASVGSLSLISSSACSPVLGKVSLTAFHSPTCPGCLVQEESLDKVIAANRNDLIVKKACVATHSEGDYLSCSSSFASGASAANALAYVCSNDSTCVSTIMTAACSDMNVTQCEETALRAAVKDLQKEKGYNVFGADAMILAQQFGVQATPTLVFNCYFRRQGTLQPQYEEKVLNEVIKAFLEG